MSVSAKQRSAGRSTDPRLQNPNSVLPDWLYPTTIVIVLGLFVCYGVWTVLFVTTGRHGPYLSPFYSPEITVHVGKFLIPPAIWVFWAPATFRLTCYYYRKAYGRGFLWHPRSCALDEPRRGRYLGETRFWAFNNLHRFALYATVVQVCFLYFDMARTFLYQGHFHLGLGTAIMAINLLALTGYTYGCHSLRHLVGGGMDCFSCHTIRHKMWRGVTVLNAAHGNWAWLSLFTVVGTDFYIKLLNFGTVPMAWWN